MNVLLLITEKSTREFVTRTLRGGDFNVNDSLAELPALDFHQWSSSSIILLDQAWLGKIQSKACSSHSILEFKQFHGHHLILLAKELTEAELLSAIQVGIDDFVFDPHHPSELIIRVANTERLIQAEQSVSTLRVDRKSNNQRNSIPSKSQGLQVQPHASFQTAFQTPTMASRTKANQRQTV